MPFLELSIVAKNVRLLINYLLKKIIKILRGSNLCGISFAAGSSYIEHFIKNSHQIQRHRGPDSQNSHFESYKDIDIGFGHQRLSIFDLSSSGSQPMLSNSGKSLIIFNGEIYNFKELAKKYKLTKLKSTSDTEVALELIELIGIDQACKEFNGMWSLIFYDRDQKKVFLSRDRLGKKPLNYLIHNNSVFVASEVKTFLCIPDFNATPNPLTAARFIGQSVQNIDQNTWINDIFMFPPGSIGELDLNQNHLRIRNIRKYWSLELNYLSELKESEATSYIKEILDNSLESRLQADVPVGIALSGGIDSSILAAIARQLKLNKKLHIFSAVNPGDINDESTFIDIVSKHLNLETNKFSLESSGVENLSHLLKLVNYYNDGPVTSFSSILFYKLMEAASSKNIKVVLTGQGADEAFCGYRKYPIFAIKNLIDQGKYLQAINLMSHFIRRNTLIPQINYAQAKRYLGKKNDSVLGTASRDAMLTELPRSLSINSIRDLQYDDITKYSVPSLCHYEDRMSMANSIEIRCPFLDYRLVELGYNLPLNSKLKDGWTKYSLRKAYEEYLPESIIWRKDKKGFSNPEDKWLKETLKESVYEIMSDDNSSIYKYGLVDKNSYIKLFKRYRGNDKTIWFRDVFAPYSLEIWLRSFGM